MDALDFAPDAPRDAIAQALRDPAFKALDRAAVPLIVADAGRRSVLAWNRPATDLFGADFADASRRLFAGPEPGSRRLATLVQTLPPGAPARLERLRFAFGRTDKVLTALCRKIAITDAATLLVLAFPGLRTGAPRPVPAPQPEAAASAAGGAAPASDAHLPDPKPRRLVWRTDADGHLVDASPDLAALRNAPAGPYRSLVTDAARDAALADALAARVTFGGVRTSAAGGGAIEWGGIPQWDVQGHFNGFRGYAVTRGVVSVTTDASAVTEPICPPVNDAEESTGTGETEVVASNVVPLWPAPATKPALTASEQNAFDEIARTLAGGDADAPPKEAGRSNAGHAGIDVMGNIVDLVPIGILVSRDGTALFANRTLLDLTGYPDLAAFAAAGGPNRLVLGVPDAPSDATASVHVLTREGESVPVDARIHAIEWEDGPASLLSLRRALDPSVAARAKALEATLREREGEARELSAILDTATDGVVVLDAAGAILSLNRSAEALLGREAGDVVGENFESLLADESRGPVSHYLAGLRTGGVASVMNDGREILCRGPRDGIIPVFMTVGRMGPDDAPKFCAVLRDLTAWKQAEQGWSEARREAERASSLKSDFLARISHEIRTPLNAIIGFAEVIMDERFGPIGNERYRDYMKDIHRSGEHVMSLVNDLLDLSKIEAGKMDMTFTAVDANALVGECVSLMQPGASRARVVMRLSLAPRLPRIVADERAFKQIVLNVLSNAVKYNEAGGQVIVSTARTDAGHAVVRIRDTGLGMSDSELQTALEPFGQVSTARATTGTGLGLPLTKALVEANRANFTIKSRKGEGTLVEVSFPPNRVMAE